MNDSSVADVVSFGNYKSLQGRRVTLIGGAGFIGHNMALKLAAYGAKVDIVDSLQVNHLQYIATQPNQPHRELYLKMLHHRLELLEQAGIQVHPVDARDYHRLGIILGATKPQSIVHLAAVAHANRSNKDPYSTFDHSLRTLENALDFARGTDTHFVYFSSSMVYGNFKTPTVHEDHPLEPLGIYGALKLSGEKIVEAYHQTFGLEYTIIRPSALYGPRCVSRRVSQVFLENAIEGKSLHIEGDGKEKVDFTYVDDLTEGISSALVRPEARNETFNLTAGCGRSLNDLADVIRQYFPSIPVEYTEREKLRPFRGTLSVDKAHELLGYTPRVSLETGIPKCIDAYRAIGFSARSRAVA